MLQEGGQEAEQLWADAPRLPPGSWHSLRDEEGGSHRLHPPGPPLAPASLALRGMESSPGSALLHLGSTWSQEDF